MVIIIFSYDNHHICHPRLYNLSKTGGSIPSKMRDVCLCLDGGNVHDAQEGPNLLDAEKLKISSRLLLSCCVE